MNDEMQKVTLKLDTDTIEIIDRLASRPYTPRCQFIAAMVYEMALAMEAYADKQRSEDSSDPWQHFGFGSFGIEALPGQHNSLSRRAWDEFLAMRKSVEAVLDAATKESGTA